MTASIATQLNQAACASDDYESIALSDILFEVAQPENIFIASDLHNKDGEPFDGYGSLQNSSSRLDPAYMKACSSRARKRTLAALQSYRPQMVENLRFITFTVPPVFGFDLVNALNLLDGALVLLKKRKSFKAKVSAAVFGDELTTGKRNTHFHCHAHMTGWTRKFSKADIRELREDWTDCLRSAAKKLGVNDFPINTDDGLAVAKVQQIVPKQRDETTITLAAAIQETCKYTVKGTDFKKIPKTLLCAVERVLRGRRMIVTYGAINNRKGKKKKAVYLDTTCTNDGIDLNNEGACDSVETTLPRKEAPDVPLRKQGARMLRDGQRQEWLELLQKKMRRRREWRKTQLAEQFPCATFRTLAGEEWSWRTREGLEYGEWRDNL